MTKYSFLILYGNLGDSEEFFLMSSLGGSIDNQPKSCLGLGFTSTFSSTSIGDGETSLEVTLLLNFDENFEDMTEEVSVSSSLPLTLVALDSIKRKNS